MADDSKKLSFEAELDLNTRNLKKTAADAAAIVKRELEKSTKSTAGSDSLSKQIRTEMSKTGAELKRVFSDITKGTRVALSEAEKLKKTEADVVKILAKQQKAANREAFAESVKQQFSRAGLAIQQFGTTAKQHLSQFGTTVKQAFSRIGTTVSNLWSNSLVGEGVTKAITAMRSRLKSAGNGFKELGDSAKKSGKQQSDSMDDSRKSIAELQEELKQAQAEYDRLTKDIDSHRAVIAYAEKEVAMGHTGAGYSGMDADAVLTSKKYIERYEQLQNRIAELQKRVGSLGEEEEKTGKKGASSFKQINNAVKGSIRNVIRLANTFKQVYRNNMQVAKSVASTWSKINSIFKTNKRSGDSTAKTLKQLSRTFIKYAFGVRSFFFLYRKIRKAVTEGLGSLALVDGNLNTVISNFLTALNTLRGSLASAFSPIITTVGPILTKLIGWLTDATNAIGMFLARLTGKSTYLKAVSVQQDYAGSLQDTADAANNAKDAVQDYLSGLDEIRKWPDANDSGSGGSGGGGSGNDPTAGLTWEEVEIPDPIKNFADTLKSYWQNQDWEGLGEFLANTVNGVFEKLYKVVNWDNVGPKITPVIEGITTTFNSLVDNIDWDLIGRTFGAGLNTITNSLNLFLTNLDTFNLGSKISEMLNGFISEVNWENVGNTVGLAVQRFWEFWSGAFSNFHWSDLGSSVAEAINGFFEKYKFSTTTGAIVTFLNGLFDALYNFTTTLHWEDIVTNITDGLNKFIKEFKWKENGATLNLFLQNLADALAQFATDTDWEGLGKGIADFLAEVEWGSLLIKVGKAIATAIGGVLKGLATEPEGIAVAAAIAGWFTVTNVLPIANAIATAFGSPTITKLLGGAIGSALGGGEAAAAAGAGATGAVEAGAAGTAAGVGGAFATIAAGVGVVTTAYVAGKAAIDKHTQAQQENTEESKKAASAYSTTHDKIQALLKKFEEGSATTEDYTELISLQKDATLAHEDASKRLNTATEDLNKNTENLNKLYDQGTSLLGYDGAAGAAGELGAGIEGVVDGTGKLNEEQKLLNENLKNSESTYKTAGADLKAIGDALMKIEIKDRKVKVDVVKGENLEKAGSPAQWAKDLDTTSAIEEKVKLGKAKNLTEAKSPRAYAKSFDKGNSVINETVKLVKGQALDKFGNPASWTKGLDGKKTVQEGVDIYKTGNLYNYKNAANYAQQGVGSVNIGVNLSVNNMDAFTKHIYDNARAVFDRAVSVPFAGGGILPFALGGIIKHAGSILSAVPHYASGTTRPHGTVFVAGEAGPEVMGHINGQTEILNKSQLAQAMYGAVLAGITTALQRFANLLFSHMAFNSNAVISAIQYHSLSNMQIPAIARGSAIPNNAQFLSSVSGGSVIGGTSEQALRQIIREESQNRNYEFIAQINRRTLFDEFIQEAKLRQMQTGQNPFEFA